MIASLLNSKPSHSEHIHKAIPGASYCKIRWGEKLPIGKGWQKNPYHYEQIKGALDRRQCGYGIILGFGNLVAIDIDNVEGRDRFLHHFGYLPDEAETVSWTSGKTFEGEWQPETDENTCIQTLWRLTDEQATLIQGRKVFKGNSLDIRFTGAQSVLPSHSPHPSTGKPYRWHNPPSKCEVAPMPDEVWNSLIAELYESQPSADPKVKTERLQQKQARRDGFIGSGNPLVELLDREIRPRLSLDQIFNWPGHHFKEWRGKLVGYCPQHGGKSGTAFQVNDEGEWYCHGCMAGGGPVQYRWFVRGGNGTPTGKDFVEVVAELAHEAGVSMPEFSRPEPIETEPDPDEYRAYEAAREEEERVAIAQEQERERQRREQYEARVLETQKRLNTLSYPPDLELNEEFFPDNIWQQIPTSGIVNILSRKGSGKSKAIIKPVISRLKSEGKRILSITPRVILGMEQCEKFDILWIDELGQSQKAQLTQKAGACCFDSLWKIFNQHWDVVILDEVRMGLKHLATANTAIAHRRPQILKGFAELVYRVTANGGLVLLADADLTDVEINYVKALAHPNTPIFTLLNHHKGARKFVDFYTGSKDSVHSEIFALIERSIDPETGELYPSEHPDFSPFVVTADSQIELEAIERRLLTLYPCLKNKIIRIDRKTSEEDWAKYFVAKIDSSIASAKPLIFLYSPSMGVGVSAELDYFKHCFALNFGVLEPCEFRQQLVRFRTTKNFTIWSADKGNFSDGSRSPLPEVVGREIVTNAKENSQQSVLDLAVELAKQEAAESYGTVEIDAFFATLQKLWTGKSWNNPHLTLQSEIQARANYAKPQNAVQLAQELIDCDNFEINFCAGESDKEIREAIFENKEQIKREKAELLAKGANSPMTAEEAREIKQNSKSKERERTLADGALFREFLPGVNLDADFIFKYKVGDRHWISSQFLYWLATHPEECKALDARKWKSHIFKWSQGDIYLPDLKLKVGQAKLIRDLGILELIDSGVDYRGDSPLVQVILDSARKHRGRVKRQLGLLVPDADRQGIRFIGQLLEKVGVCQKQTRSDGKTRYYRVAGNNATERRAVLMAWEQKYWDLAPHPELTGETSYITESCPLSVGGALAGKGEEVAMDELTGETCLLTESCPLSVGEVGEIKASQQPTSIEKAWGVVREVRAEIEDVALWVTEGLIESARTCLHLALDTYGRSPVADVLRSLTPDQRLKIESLGVV
ncbi:MAG: plasmid replication protein, CyRepA1 family [Actinomycetota bacterium]